jgi:hypothetical protein
MADTALQVSAGSRSVPEVKVRRLIPVFLYQERLRDHAKAFDGLLSLIPAKMYYGEDTSVR